MAKTAEIIVAITVRFIMTIQRVTRAPLRVIAILGTVIPVRVIVMVISNNNSNTTVPVAVIAIVAVVQIA